jgi:hypothetical protein
MFFSLWVDYIDFFLFSFHHIKKTKLTEKKIIFSGMKHLTINIKFAL